MMIFRSSHLPRWLWLWLPLGYLPFEGAVAAIDRQNRFYEEIFLHETGFVEIATAVLLIPAAILSARYALLLWRAGSFLAAALMLVFTLGCVFLFGEEISYGQHIFGWATPEYFQAYNAQRETNLHNLEFVNKSLMKWLLFLGILLSGIVLPLGFRWYGVPKWVARSALGPVLVDSVVCLPTAAMAIGMHLLVKIVWWSYSFEFHDNGLMDMRETTELYIAYFLALYPLTLNRSFGVASNFVNQNQTS